MEAQGLRNRRGGRGGVATDSLSVPADTVSAVALADSLAVADALNADTLATDR